MSFWSKIWGNIKAYLEAERKRSPVAKYAMSQAEAYDDVLRMLHDPDPKIRCLAAEGLGLVPDPRSIPALAVARTDSDPAVQKSAVQALDRINPEWRKLPEARVAAEYELNALSATLMPLLNKVPALLVTAEKIIALDKKVQSKDPGAFDAAMEALREPDSRIRFRAPGWLAQLGDLRAVPALMEARSDPDEKVRQKTEEALDKLSPGWRQSGGRTGEIAEPVAAAGATASGEAPQSESTPEPTEGRAPSLAEV